jgi:hypothetical protein
MLAPSRISAAGRKIRFRKSTLFVLLACLLILGCMRWRFGADDGGDLLVQEGETLIQPHQVIEICYATPYASPPQLETFWTDRCVVVDQQATFFRVRNEGSSARRLSWRARGPQANLPPAPAWQGSRVVPVETQPEAVPPDNPVETEPGAAGPIRLGGPQ